MIKVYFNGIELTKYFKVTNISRGLLPSRINYSIESEFRHGSDFDGFKYGERIIKLQGVLLTESTEQLQLVKRELAGLLYVTDPAPLSFSDEPDKYYMAIPDGSADIEQFLGAGQLELQFLCNDPFAHAKEITEIKNEGRTAVNIYNGGTHLAYPVLEAVMTSKNSLVAFINNRGKILQFGDPDLVDKKEVKEPEVLINTRNFTKTSVEEDGWLINQEQFPNRLESGHYMKANLPLQYFDGGYAGVELGHKGTGAWWSGACLSKVLPADSSGHVGAVNFEGKFRVKFETHTIQDTGVHRVELRDKNDVQICCVNFYKTTTTNNEAIAYVAVDNIARHTVTFQPTYFNQFTSTNKEFSIKKFGSQFTFSLGNVSQGGFIFNFDCPKLKDVEVMKVICFSGTYSTQETRMIDGISGVTVIKHDVDKIVDAETLFIKGDILTADTATGLIYLNGRESLNIDTLGNNWEDFYLERGANSITTVVSSFADVPDVTIRYRERWL